MDPCAEHACSLCCRETEMPLRLADVARLAARGHDPGRFVREDDGYLLLANEGGACVFLKDGRCSVYQDRPEGCRLYPLFYDDAWQPSMDALCPWREEFPRGEQDHRRLRALARVLVREREARVERD